MWGMREWSELVLSGKDGSGTGSECHMTEKGKYLHLIWMETWVAFYNPSPSGLTVHLTELSAWTFSAYIALTLTCLKL